jgi:hypothetical protein
MKSFIINYYIKKHGAKKFICMLIEDYLPGFHLSKNPKKRIADEVTETRIEG